MVFNIKHAAVSAATKLSTSSEDRHPDSLSDSKYLLKITAGPSYDESTHTPLIPNSSQAHTITTNPHMLSSVKVRIRNYSGLPLSAPSSSAYFGHPTRRDAQYSIGCSFVPRGDINAADVVWGNDFDHPVRDRLPPGFNFAMKIVKEFVDPGIEADAYADEPWLYAPALSTFFEFRVGEVAGGGMRSGRSSVSEGSGESEETGEAGGLKGEDIPHVDEEEPLQEGADGSGADVREQYGMPVEAPKRRKFFLKDANREKFTFEKGRLYQADFFNPYIDFSTFSLKLPGFSIGVIKYINDKTHKLRWVFKNRKTGDVYFVIVFTLLFGDELEEELALEKERWKQAKAQAGVGIEKQVDDLTDSDRKEVEEAYIHPDLD